MPRLSACIEMIFRELPFVDRIAATKAAGLDTVEFWGWRNKVEDMWVWSTVPPAIRLKPCER